MAKAEPALIRDGMSQTIIDAAESVSDITTAVSAFKAQVASVEAAAGNTPASACAM